MSFADYWYKLQRKNTALVSAASVKLSIESLQNELEKAHYAGKLEGMSEHAAQVSRPPYVFDHIFGRSK